MLVLCATILCLAVTCWLFLRGWSRSHPLVPGRVRTVVVLGSGGHTTEMMKMISSLDSQIYTPRIYFIAETDKFSLSKLKEVMWR